MKRISILTPLQLAFWTLLSMSVSAQTSLVTTRIATVPPGASFTVDGTVFTSTAVMTWPQGSKHVVSIAPVQISPDGGFRYTFGAWADSSGLLIPSSENVQVITADPAVTSLQATVSVAYRANLVFFSTGTSVSNGNSAAPVACGAPSSTQTPIPGQPNSPLTGFGPGLVYIGGQCFTNSQQFWAVPGETLQLNAFPYDGFVFLGWSGSILPNSAYLLKLKVNSPITIVASFSPARKVTIYTNPPKLQVLVDRTVINTMDPGGNVPISGPVGVFQWAQDSTHTMAAPSPQLDLVGKMWVFDSWDFGGGQNALYKVAGPVPTPTSITAKFVPGGVISLLTNPVGLKLTIDGRDNYPGPGYNFDWAIGVKHTITAPATNTDSRGRTFVFKGWSNGGAASQSISVDTQDGLRLTANYELLNRVTLAGTSPGLKVQIDGVDCLLPCVLDRASTSQAKITAPPSIAMGYGARMDFAGWSDGGPADRVVSFTNDIQNLSLSYKIMYQMRVSSDPVGGANLKVSPASADGFYTPDTMVFVSAQASPGFKFRRWDGDLTTASTNVVIDMGSPRSLKALLDKTPYIAPAGVRNAAGETPGPGVAPGSIISILGANLADSYVAGPNNPLSQTVGNITVRIGGTLLPLLFVSPDQINAQLPSDLAPGSYTIYVKSGLQLEIPATLTVSRNAPGLFNQPVDGHQFAVAAHEDGTPITADSPARRGETVTLFGTGFGPYDKAYPDGFPVPQSLQLLLADAVEVHSGDLTLTPDWAGAIAGMIGTTGTKLKITDDLPGSQPVELRVRVQGVDSNKVLLPIE